MRMVGRPVCHRRSAGPAAERGRGGSSHDGELSALAPALPAGDAPAGVAGHRLHGGVAVVELARCRRRRCTSSPGTDRGRRPADLSVARVAPGAQTVAAKGGGVEPHAMPLRSCPSSCAPTSCSARASRDGARRPRAGARPRARRAAGATSPPSDRGGGRRRPPTPSGWPTTCAPSSATTRSTLFPAWETLPFERVSPGVETMGRRLRTHVAPARPGRACPGGRRGAGAGARAAARPPRRGRRARSSSRPATSVDPDELVERPGRAPATAASTRSSTAARSRCAARSSTCSRPPPTRRCASTCGATRSTASPSSRSTDQRSDDRRRAEVEIFPCRELLPTDEVRERAERARRRRAVGPRAVGAPRRGPDLRRHGVVAAVAHRRTSTSLLDLLGADAQVAAGRAAPHARPRRRHPRRGGRPRRARWPRPGARSTPSDDDASRACTSPFDRLLRPHRRARRGRSPPRPRAPDVATVAAAGWDPVVGDGAAPGHAAHASCWPTATASSWPPTAPASAGRLTSCSASRAALPLDERRVDLAGPAASSSSRRSSGASSCRRSSWRCSPRPTSPAGAAPTAGARPRKPRRRRASSTTSRPGDYVVHYQHGVGPLRRHGEAGHRRRRARLPAARVPRRRQALRPVRPDRRGAPLHRRRDADAAPARRRRLAEDQGPGARPRSREIAQELVVLYQKPRAHARATPSPPTRRGSASSRRRSRTRRRPTSSRPSTRSRPTWRSRVADGPPGVRRRRLRQDRGRDPRRVQGGAGRQAGGRARARPRCSPSSTSRPSASASPATRCGSRCCRRFLTPAPGARRWSTGVARRRRSTSSSAPTACCPTTSRSRTSACSWSTRSSASASPTRRRSSSCKTDVDVLTLTATPIPRTLEMSLTGIRDLTLLNTPPAERQPILTYVGEYDERAVAEAIRRELLREGQVFFVHNRVQDIEQVARPSCATSCPRPASPSPTARWTRARSSRSSSTSGRASTTCSSARRSSSRASTCRR